LLLRKDALATTSATSQPVAELKNEIKKEEEWSVVKKVEEVETLRKKKLKNLKLNLPRLRGRNQEKILSYKN